MSYLVLKALHIIFMVTWFAGLFYLPRLFIYHRAAEDPVSLDRFVIMERRLFAIMTIGAVATAAFGLAMLAINSGLLRVHWMQVKLLLLAGLIGYHAHTRLVMKELSEHRCTRSDKWLRLYNEVPVLFLFGIILLAVTKAF